MLLKKSFFIASMLLLLLPILFSAFKYSQNNFEISDIIPREIYTVSLELEMSDLPKKAVVKSYLPESNQRQEIRNHTWYGDSITVTTKKNEFGTQIIWDVADFNDVLYTYEYEVEGKYVRFDLPLDSPFEEHSSIELQQFLSSDPFIQTSHVQIESKAKELKKHSVLATLRSNFAYVKSIRSSNTRLLTDAVSVLRLNRASCNGKSRLFTALCRAQGIPSRVVGGTILENVQKRTSHLWSEIYYGGSWIPFDVMNDHFAMLPANYLQLYTGDVYLFNYTKDLNFDYQFDIKKKYQSLNEKRIEGLSLWPLLNELHLPMDLLRSLLLLPLAALLIAIFRNVVGINSFGILLPALIGLALVNVDLVTGLTAFGIVIVLVALLHLLLEKWSLLHVPKVAIILTSVIITLLTFGIAGVLLDWEMGEMMIYLPIVIISITAERFAKVLNEEDLSEALKMLLNTALISLLTCLIFRSKLLIGVFLTFPELYLPLIVILLFLGRWIGMRISEYRRFSPTLN
ncbi:MAG: 7TM domain-containing protein [Saprospiraceae bacterium]|nr:7TM domain-containing protein [Saprospiraceae bacterium]